MDRSKGPVAQGDCLIVPIDSIPKNVMEQLSPENDLLVVAHSETGHHHTLPAKAAKVFVASAMLMYVRILKEAELKHHRPYDTHESHVLPPGDYAIYRQREGSPEGWRQVQD